MMKKMRAGSVGDEDAAEGMKEFVALCQIKFGGQGGKG